MRLVLLLASAGKFAIITVMGDIDASSAQALATAIDWLDGESVIIVSLESCTSIDAAAIAALLQRSGEPQVVYVLPDSLAARRAMSVACYTSSFHFADDVEGAIRLATSLDGPRFLPFRPLSPSLN